MSYSDEEERLLQLLKSQHQFPSAFPIKILFTSREGRGAELLATVESETGVRVAGTPTERASRKGTYTSLTADFAIGRPEQIIEVYRHLATVDDIVSYF